MYDQQYQIQSIHPDTLYQINNVGDRVPPCSTSKLTVQKDMEVVVVI